ncbi:MAG: hypothetical protein ABI365_01835, partial [Lysobacteraceae bacterium]
FVECSALEFEHGIVRRAPEARNGRLYAIAACIRAGNGARCAAFEFLRLCRSDNQLRRPTQQNQRKMQDE